MRPMHLYATDDGLALVLLPALNDIQQKLVPCTIPPAQTPHTGPLLNISSEHLSSLKPVESSGTSKSPLFK
jgi:hypothetical protein